MRNIEEILRLKYESGLSHRAIGQSCAISAGTVSDYVSRAKAAGLSWPLPKGLSGEKLEDLLFPVPGQVTERQIPQPDWTEIHKAQRQTKLDLATLSKILGHENLTTTARYLHPDSTLMAEMIEKL